MTMENEDKMLASAAKRRLENTQKDQMRRGAIADKRHAKIADTDYNGDYDRRDRDLDRANTPTDAMQSRKELAPITSRAEGYLHDVNTIVYQGDDDFLPNYRRQVLDERNTASEKDAAAFARANMGLDPNTGKYTINNMRVTPRRGDEIRTEVYPGHRLFSGEIDNAAPGSQSEWGTRAPLKK